MINSLFGIPIYSDKIILNEKEIFYFLNLEYKKLNQEYGYKTKNNYVLDNDSIKTVKNQVLNHLNIFLFDYLKIKKNVNFKMLNSWCTRYETKANANGHLHSNSLFSGVFYIKVNKFSGQVRFHKNNFWRNLLPKCVNVEFDESNEFNGEYWQTLPEVGDLLLFPSFLEHSTLPNESNEERFCCAFNFYLEGQIGGDMNTLKIKLE